MKSGIRKAGLVALAGAIIGVGGYGFEKEEKLYKQTKISLVSNKNPRPAWDTYSEFGVTFKYPPELNLKATDTATAEEGSIKARGNGKLLHLRWVRGISGKQSIAKKVLSPYIRSRAPKLGEGGFYLGESKWLKVNNKQTALSRFYTTDERGVFLNVVYAWYEKDSNRTFVLCCGAVWEQPVIVTDGSRFVPEWPKLDDDPSYDFCQSVLESFKDKLKRSFKHSERGYSLSVKGTVTKQPYPKWASLTSKGMAYLVQAEVKNTDERSFCFDCVKGAFRPDSGTPLVIENRIRDANTQEALEITLSSGQDKEWQFGTDGYTQDLLANARGKPLKFSLTFFLKDEVVAGPYFTTLPDIKMLPISVGAISVGGKKCSLAFSKSLKSAPAQIRLYEQTKIAFFSERDGNYEIYIMNADGSEQKRLTNNPADDLLPFWSPDGKKIAFVSERDGNPEVYIMNADGSEQKNLTNNPADDAEPSWSPDGKKIAFYSTRDGNYEIYVMNADGSEPKRLTNNPGLDLASSWSPDGKKIAFNSKRDGNTEIYVINADGSEQKRLTNNPAGSTFPSWSPDGRKIAFESRRDGQPEVYVMNADGSEQKRLTNNPAVDGSPAWSPDGRKIAFMSKRDGNFEIYVMNADGNEQKRLTNNPADDGFPSWSPFLGSQINIEPR